MANPYHPEDILERKLAKAFSKLETDQDILNFLRDLLTPAEIKEFSKRLEIARILATTQKSYLEIAKDIGTSTTTVTRVAQWLNNGCGGYQKVLNQELRVKR